MRERRTYSETKAVSITLAQNTLDLADLKLKNTNDFKNRSDLIDTAIQYYLNLKPCPFCGELNPSGARWCGFCRRDMTYSQQELDIAKDLYLEQHPEHKDTEDIRWFVHLSNDEIGKLLNGEQIPACKHAHNINQKEYRENIRQFVEDRKKGDMT